VQNQYASEARNEAYIKYAERALELASRFGAKITSNSPALPGLGWCGAGVTV